MGMAVAWQPGSRVARSCQFWHLFMALSGDAGAGLTLARTVEHALDERISIDH